MSWLTILAVALVGIAMWILYGRICSLERTVDCQRDSMLRLLELVRRQEDKIHILKESQNALVNHWAHWCGLEEARHDSEEEPLDTPPPGGAA